MFQLCTYIALLIDYAMSLVHTGSYALDTCPFHYIHSAFRTKKMRFETRDSFTSFSRFETKEDERHYRPKTTKKCFVLSGFAIQKVEVVPTLFHSLPDAVIASLAVVASESLTAVVSPTQAFAPLLPAGYFTAFKRNAYLLSLTL